MHNVSAITVEHQLNQKATEWKFVLVFVRVEHDCFYVRNAYISFAEPNWWLVGRWFSVLFCLMTKINSSLVIVRNEKQKNFLLQWDRHNMVKSRAQPVYEKNPHKWKLYRSSTLSQIWAWKSVCIKHWINQGLLWEEHFNNFLYIFLLLLQIFTVFPKMVFEKVWKNWENLDKIGER